MKLFLFLGLCISVLLLSMVKTQEEYGDKITSLDKTKVYSIYNNQSKINSDDNVHSMFRINDPAAYNGGPPDNTVIKATGGAFWCNLAKNPAPSEIEKCIYDIINPKLPYKKNMFNVDELNQPTNAKFEGTLDSVYLIKFPPTPQPGDPLYWKVVQIKK